jgi:hypothetical protein
MVSRVQPGGTWNMDSLGYCAPGPAEGRSPTATLTVIVDFGDDDGRTGTLTATVQVTE